MTGDPRWYKDAVIYELHVRAFGDSDADGVGDFDGLTRRLDHLQKLGVTALWLLPFYPSPLRDDGYDIADYAGIHPSYGTLRSFRRFLAEAHARGLRVITELVLNHTSDQHPWFQRARRDRAGGRWRDFYVWSDTPDRYPDARIIFEDYETSNWTWDPVAGAYYWHRFFHHQPDLNYENPEVQERMLSAVDRWFEMGVDGVRIDAVPYLFEEEGTNCENLPATHDFLKRLRAHIDARFEDRMLLAEANQWPEDAVAYFGDPEVGGDECHMAFHFPVMPRLYMALRMEDREPILDILQQTPPIPDGCQWAMFLRNHDELTLEMVTDEERDYMYRAYATDPQSRVNVGIRRRLAPLLGNDRRAIELMMVLLLSLPGTPVLYYGDEIGMGDNVYLGDRDAVRTPMQWSSGKNAGFSDANPQQLYLPVIIDPDHHYESVNVEAEERNPASLLWWMRQIIALRQQHATFGRGTIEFLYPENAKVLAFVRSHEDRHVLVVVNLSRFAQAVQLDLHAHRGAVPVELFGDTEFPAVGDTPYPLTLGPRGYFWFELDQHRSERRYVDGDDEVPTVAVTGGWQAAFRGRSRTGIGRAAARYLPRNRWYAGRQRNLRSVELLDAVPARSGRGAPPGYWLLLQADYTTGEPDTYVTPVVAATEERAEEILADHPGAAIAWIEDRSGGPRVLLHDAMVDPSFTGPLLDTLRRRRAVASPATGAEVRASGSARFRRLVAEVEDPGEIHPAIPQVEQSNSSVVYGNRFVLKVFRRVQEGVNPDLEIGRYLTEEAAFPHAAPLLGALEYQRGRGEPRTLAVLTGYVPNEGDAWRYTLDALGLFYERALTSVPDDDNAVPAWAGVLGLARDGALPPDPLASAVGPYLDSAELLGRRLAELHHALAAGTGPDFAPVRFSTLWQRSLLQAMRAKVRPTMQLVRRTLDGLDEAARADAEAVLGSQSSVVDVFARLTDHRIAAERIRIHGDLHLGQVLHAGRDVVFIDFEGEPSRSATERRIKRSVLADVAGMLRSYQYAGHAGLDAVVERGLVGPDDLPALEARGRAWQRWVSVRFLTGYLTEATGARYLPADPDDVEVLLTAYLLDKALYEIRYDLSYRPGWAHIPLRGVLDLLGGG